MSEDGEMWAEYKKERHEKKAANEKYSIEFLRKNNIPFEVLDESVKHYRVMKVWSFWPSTGVFYNPKTKEKGRGLKNLIKKLKS